MSDLNIGRERSGGLATAHAGAIAIAPRLKGLRAQIYNMLESRGPMTDREIIDTLRAAGEHGYDGSLGPRRCELNDWMVPSLVTNSGETKLNPDTGLPNTLWRLTTEEERRKEVAGVDTIKKARLRKRIAKYEATLEGLYAKLAAA